MPKQTKWYSLEGKKVQIVLEFSRNKVQWVVVETINDDYDRIQVTTKDRLTEWEKSYTYRNEKERDDKQKAFENRKAKLVHEIQKKAISALESRIRFNVAFGDSSSGAAVGLQIAEALKKIVKGYKDTDILKEEANNG